MAKDLRRRGGERPIVHEPVGCAPGAGPSADRLRQLPMRDVDVQRLVGGHFEKRHLTIAGERVRFVEAPDSRFDSVDASNRQMFQPLIDSYHKGVQAATVV